MFPLEANALPTADLRQPGIGLLGIALDHVATAACYIDPQERMQSWNRAYERFFPEHAGVLRAGWDYTDNLRRYFQVNSDEEDPARFEEIVTAGIARHRQMRHPSLFQKKDGRWLRSQVIWFEDGGCLKMWTDESAAHVGGGVGDPLSDYGVAMFDASGQFLRANRHMGELFPRAVDLFHFGATYADHLKRYAETSFAPGEEDKVALLAGRADPLALPLSRPVVIRRKDGGWLQVEDRRLFDGSLNMLWLDISAVKSLEATNEELNRLVRELTEARTQAESASRAKSEFVAMMSHELRTPLHAIIGFAEVIRDLVNEKPGLDPLAMHSGDILEAGRRLLRSIDGMLDLARIDAGRVRLDPRPIDPDKLLATCLRLTSEDAERGGVALSKTVADGCPAVWADEAGLRKVLLNVLSNAVKFTPRGGRVILSAEPIAAGRLRIAVADTGIGIPEDRTAGMFEAFAVADPSYERKAEGAGIGLAVVKELVKRMEGEVSIASALGQGTVVEILLPGVPGTR